MDKETTNAVIWQESGIVYGGREYMVVMTVDGPQVSRFNGTQWTPVRRSTTRNIVLAMANAMNH